MIKGMTHDSDGILNKITKYRGKISTGYAPREGANKENYPVAAGFFRMLKEVTQTKRIGASQTVHVVKDWVLNEQAQNALEQTLSSKTPRRIEIVSLYKTPEEMWESSMAMYSSSSGLLCKSHGEGTVARCLKLGPNDEREWINREFNGVQECAFKNCPDYQSKACKAIGLMKVFPVIDLSPQPYRFETRSINTILGIESSLSDMWMLLNAAHAVKQMEAGQSLPFDGFFGAKLYLVHRKVKSGGREVFITDLVPTLDFTEQVMEPIKRGLAQKSSHARMVGAGGSVSLLEAAGHKFMEPESDNIDDIVPLDLADEQGIAVNFNCDADVIESSDPPNVTDDFVEDRDNDPRKVAERLLE